MTERYDVTIVGGGHNALVAAAYLGRGGFRTLVLERLPHTGGAAVSARAFAGVDARLSRYSYLVALLPTQIIRDLGLDLELRARSVALYAPTVRDGRWTGLLVERQHGTATAESFRALTGGDEEYAAWRAFYAEVGAAAQVLAPTLTEPLMSRAAAARAIGADTWRWLAEAPIGSELAARFRDDTVRGVVATDAVIGTFASVDDPSLTGNRCLLHHLIGNGTGEWKVPVGGMGAVTDALLQAARAAGADVRTATEVVGVTADEHGAETTYRAADGEHTVASRLVLSGVAPAVLDDLLGIAGDTPRPVGAQLKINLLLERLPEWRSGIDTRTAFAGTLHIAQSHSELEAAFQAATSGRLPDPQPGEFYCHSLTDTSILGDDLVAAGYQTLTYFGVQTPPSLFAADDGSRARAAVEHALAALDEHLVEPLAGCLARDEFGEPCIEYMTPTDVERALNMPGGHIYHGDLHWPWLDAAEEPSSPAERWGVATPVPSVLVCGSGAKRGGGVSGLGGHNAAHAALELLGGEG